MTMRERLLRYGWAGIQALPWMLALLGSTWAGYQWPLPLPPRWREGVTLALLLTYAWWRSRKPWNPILLFVLSWCIGSVWTLHPLPSLTFLGTVVLITGLLSFLWVLLYPTFGPGWPVVLFAFWLVYTGMWLYGFWGPEFRNAWWYGGLGVVTFFLFLVEGWRALDAERQTLRIAISDLYIAFNVLIWLLYAWWK